MRFAPPDFYPFKNTIFTAAGITSENRDEICIICIAMNSSSYSFYATKHNYNNSQNMLRSTNVFLLSLAKVTVRDSPRCLLQQVQNKASGCAQCRHHHLIAVERGQAAQLLFRNPLHCPDSYSRLPCFFLPSPSHCSAVNGNGERSNCPLSPLPSHLDCPHSYSRLFPASSSSLHDASPLVKPLCTPLACPPFHCGIAVTCAQLFGNDCTPSIPQTLLGATKVKQTWWRYILLFRRTCV